MTLRAPFPWFGGKSRAAPIVWRAMGDVANFVEPFAGSLAVLLGRPTEPRIETVNDLDCYVANAWRAIAADPDAVAHHTDWPVNEADLSARHQWLVDRVEFRERMAVDPEFYDARIAGWWIWGVCSWIGSGWCDVSRATPARACIESSDAGNAGRGVNRQLPHASNAGQGVHRKLPHAGDAGRGVNRQLPHAGDAGRGVNRQLPHAGDAGQGVHRKLLHAGDGSLGVVGWMRALQDRLRRVRVMCGDWHRVVTPSVTHRHGVTGVLLDPPYGEGALDYGAGGNADASLASDVRAWAVENAGNPLLRIVLCGYDGQHEMPADWRCVAWKSHGGYGGGRGTEADANSYRERVWLSPHCQSADGPLFALGATP